MEILHRDDLPPGGFAGVRERRVVKGFKLFGAGANDDGSWPGIGNFVYLADAALIPGGDTGMHPHREIDVITLMVEGRIAHQGTLGHGEELGAGMVQIQRAGGKGFEHNEINPDATRNRLLQMWVLPETAGGEEAYRLYDIKPGELIRVYGGPEDQEETLAAKTQISVAQLSTGESVAHEGGSLFYVVTGAGVLNDQPLVEGNLVRAERLNFEAQQSSMIVMVHLL